MREIERTYSRPTNTRACQLEVSLGEDRKGRYHLLGGHVDDVLSGSCVLSGCVGFDCGI